MGRENLLQLLAELRAQVERALAEEPNEKVRMRLELILSLTDSLRQDGDEAIELH